MNEKPRTSWGGMGTKTIVAAVCVAAGGRCLGDEINLRGSVRLSAGAEVVRLADVAELVGALAQEHAQLVLARIDDHAQVVEIPVTDVRSQLDDAGIHWGKVQLSGSVVIVRPLGTQAAQPPLAMMPASIETTARAHRITAASSEAAELVGLSTVRGLVAAAIVQGLGVSPDALRLTLDDRGEGILDMDADAERFELEPLGSLSSDRIELALRTWAHGRIQRRYTITAQPQLKTDVVVLRRDLDRGEEINEGDCSVETRWLPPSQANLVPSLVEAVGRVADARLTAGDLLRKKHVKREVLIKRGDRVMVRCLVGGVVISMEADAHTDAAEGEQIELRKLGERNTFLAIATGPGAAVLDLGR